MFVSVYRPEVHGRPQVPHLLCAHGLPRMEKWQLVHHMRRLSPSEAEMVLRHRFLPLPHRGLWRPCVATDANSLRAAQSHGGCAVARADARDFLHAMQQVFGPRLIEQATHQLEAAQPHFSARVRLSQGQRETFVLAAIGLLLLAWMAPQGAMMLVSLVFGLFYLLLAALHISAARHRPETPPIHLLADDELPIYTVLVPLYRESRVLPQLLQALARLDYPASKLDIKLLVEEEDEETRESLQHYVLPAHIEVLVVPRGAPRTKPRALNYGLAFARGELLTIYDAEDVPHPGQLRLAASILASRPHDVACLQAPLAWYNAEAGFFTRMLAVDYAAHFAVVLPWLQALGLPLPLGGTSNHFRIDVLKAAGGWDPFNVTEDADLGLRLARLGWRTAMLPRLTTLEEACADYECWRNQRARWIKGWLQTFLVHLRAPVRLLQEVGPGGMFVLHALLGAGVFASLLHPLFLLLTAVVMFNPQLLGDGLLHTWLLAQGLVVLTAGYAAALLSALEGLRRTGQRHLLPWLVCLPFYWLLISLAAWLAVWDFVRQPHHWRKTAHGFFLLFR